MRRARSCLTLLGWRDDAIRRDQGVSCPFPGFGALLRSRRSAERKDIITFCCIVCLCQGSQLLPRCDASVMSLSAAQWCCPSAVLFPQHLVGVDNGSAITGPSQATRASARLLGEV